MRALLMAVAASALLLGPTVATTALAQGAASAAPTMLAPRYLELTASHNTFMIESSRLALERSTDPAIRTYAEMIVAEQTEMSADLAASARASNLAMPSQAMTPQQAQMLEQLRGAPANQFDALYRQFHNTANQEALDYQKAFAAGGDTPAQKEMAARWWPCIQAHLGAVPAAPPALKAGERG